MTKKILYVIFAQLWCLAMMAQVNPIAGVYSYKNADGAQGTIRVATGTGGQIYFDAESVTASGNTASLKPADGAWVKLAGKRATYSHRFNDCTYTLTLDFNEADGTLTAKENYSKWAPIFGSGASLAGTYKKESGTVGDTRGYLYSVMGDGTLGLTRGGRYCGTVRIPESVKMADGSEKTVSTIRKRAMQVPTYEKSANALREVYVPSTVTMVGVDAFAGNSQLQKVEYDNPRSVYVEAGAYMGCPNLQLTPATPIYGYCNYYNNEDRAAAYAKFMFPIGKKMTGEELAQYKWACFKHWHNRIGNPVASNMDDDNCMPAFSDWRKVKGYIFSLRDPKQGPNMFWGYDPHEAIVVMVGNDYMGTHRFPQYNRWRYGEEAESKSPYFKQQMEKRYGRKVRYSYVAATLRDDGRNVSVTEFEIANNEALVVIAWSRADDIICTWEKRQQFEAGEGGSVWNVDDDGEYGIPAVLCIAEGDNGALELILNHQAPESVNIERLVRHGDQFVEEGGDQWYVWYD
ncbi:MAG: hypothetical protein IKQ68_01395 [Prevotella sp.]|nr:hypothetical protein [Prevotella sp.]